jgi:hypothetical protein
MCFKSASLLDSHVDGPRVIQAIKLRGVASNKQKISTLRTFWTDHAWLCTSLLGISEDTHCHFQEMGSPDSPLKDQPSAAVLSNQYQGLGRRMWRYAVRLLSEQLPLFRLRYKNDNLVSYALSIWGQSSGIMLYSVVRISGCYSVVAMDNRSINEVPLSVPLIVQIVSCFSCLKSYLP